MKNQILVNQLLKQSFLTYFLKIIQYWYSKKLFLLKNKILPFLYLNVRQGALILVYCVQYIQYNIKTTFYNIKTKMMLAVIADLPRLKHI